MRRKDRLRAKRAKRARLLEWVEPSPEGDVLTRRCTAKEAIKHQRLAASGKGYEYPTDDDALADFIDIHWAKWVDAQ